MSEYGHADGHASRGAWVVGGQAVAHFLFADGTAAREALESAGIEVLAEREVVVQRLKQDVPGQLGMLTRRMAEAGVNIIRILPKSQDT